MIKFLEELSIEQKEQQQIYYFKKILPFLVIIMIFISAIVILYNIKQSNKILSFQENGDFLIKAINFTNSDKNLTFKTLNYLENQKSTRIHELAIIAQIGIEINDNNIQSALEKLKIIINSNSTQLTVGYAHLLILTFAIDNALTNLYTSQDIEKSCIYFDNPKKPFFALGSIMKAIWYIKNDSFVKAREILQDLIALENVNLVLKEQAKALLTTVQ